MATKRMFSRSVVTTDAFMDLSATAKILYFYLNMAADDDGFVDNPRTIMRMCGASVEDWKQLVTNQYILLYEDGVVVIRHWLVHNTLGKDRYHETEYLEKKAMLYLTEKKEYTFDAAAGKPVEIKNRAWAELNAADHLKMTTAALLPDETPGDPLDGSMNPPEEDEEQPAADPEAEAKAAKKAAAKRAKAEEDKAADEMMQQLLDMYPEEKRTQKYKLGKAVKKKLYKLGMDKVTKALNRYLDSMRGRETYIYGAGNFFSDYIYQYIDEETATPNTPTPAPAAAPSTPAAEPLPQMPLDDDFIPDF